MSDHPYKPFNDAAQNKQPATLRNKDNAAPRPTPPAQARHPAPNIAPPGMKGIQSKPQLPSQTLKKADTLVSIVRTHSKPELLTGGRFNDQPGHGFAVEISPYRSVAGIEGGKITALEIQQEGKIVAQYKDMNWTRIPEKEEHKQLVQRLQDQFGEPRRDFVPIVPLDQDKDQGHER